MRVLRLVKHLPPESAFAHCGAGWWTSELELLAAAVELTHQNVVATIALGARKGTTLPDPLRIPRPTDTAAPVEAARPASIVDWDAFLNGGM